MVTSNQELRYGVVLMAHAGAEPAAYHRQVARYYHVEHLQPALQARPEQQIHPFAEWEYQAWQDYAERYWWEAELARVPIGNISSLREFVPGRLWHPTLPDGWFNHWFQSLRTALGMQRSGREGGDQRLLDRARRVLNLCLAAPQREGAFPVVAYWDGAKEQVYWERDNTWAGLANWYHCFDMCWTAYWLLAWHEELQGADPRILPRCRALGELLLRAQLPSGCVPSFFLTRTWRPIAAISTTTMPRPQAVRCSCSACTPSPVRRGILMPHAERCAIFGTAWCPPIAGLDFETFFSCSAKPVDFRCPHTDQLPQNNL